MGEAIVAVLDVLLKCAEGIREVDKGLKEEKRGGETRGFEEEESSIQLWGASSQGC